MIGYGRDNSHIQMCEAWCILYSNETNILIFLLSFITHLIIYLNFQIKKFWTVFNSWLTSWGSFVPENSSTSSLSPTALLGICLLFNILSFFLQYSLKSYSCYLGEFELLFVINLLGIEKLNENNSVHPCFLGTVCAKYNVNKYIWSNT